MKHYYVFIPGSRNVQGPFPAAMIRDAYTQGIYDQTTMLQELHTDSWVCIRDVLCCSSSSERIHLHHEEKDQGEANMPPPPPVRRKSAAKKWLMGCLTSPLVGVLITRGVIAAYREPHRGDSVRLPLICLLIVVVVAWIYMIVTELIEKRKKRK